MNWPLTNQTRMQLSTIVPVCIDYIVSGAGNPLRTLLTGWLMGLVTAQTDSITVRGRVSSQKLVQFQEFQL